jgi:hypothetical protein
LRRSAGSIGTVQSGLRKTFARRYVPNVVYGAGVEYFTGVPLLAAAGHKRSEDVRQLALYMSAHRF